MRLLARLVLLVIVAPMAARAHFPADVNSVPGASGGLLWPSKRRRRIRLPR